MPNPFETASPLASLSLTSRTAATQTLTEMLESQGIRVSSIYFGPLAQHAMRLPPESHSVKKYAEALPASPVLSHACPIRSNWRFSQPFGTCSWLQLFHIF
jgi:hypothetical protein